MTSTRRSDSDQGGKSLRYLVTGGAGFIGSHLADALVDDGHEVLALDNLSTGSLANTAQLRSNDHFSFVPGSVLDAQLIDELVEECDAVVHLAAAVGVRLIVEQPLKTLVTNIRGSETVLEAAHRYRRPVFVASTSEIYGKNSSPGLTETSDRILGAPSMNRWAYSTSKAVEEYLAFAYYKDKGIPTVIARFFNTVGPRQSAAYGMVIPRMIEQALRNEPVTVFGDGEQSRCFCHVHDVVSAIRALLDRPEAVGQAFNVGSTEEVTMNQLAGQVVEVTGSTGGIINIPYEDAYGAGFEDMRRRVPSTAKIEQLTGWRASNDLKGILLDMVRHLREPASFRGDAASDDQAQRWQ